MSIGLPCLIVNSLVEDRFSEAMAIEIQLEGVFVKKVVQIIHLSTEACYVNVPRRQVLLSSLLVG